MSAEERPEPPKEPRALVCHFCGAQSAVLFVHTANNAHCICDVCVEKAQKLFNDNARQKKAQEDEEQRIKAEVEARIANLGNAEPTPITAEPAQATYDTEVPVEGAPV
jgi:hypothetical protein